jgi:hypothetical protein
MNWRCSSRRRAPSKIIIALIAPGPPVGINEDMGHYFARRHSPAPGWMGVRRSRRDFSQPVTGGTAASVDDSAAFAMAACRTAVTAAISSASRFGVVIVNSIGSAFWGADSVTQSRLQEGRLRYAGVPYRGTVLRLPSAPSAGERALMDGAPARGGRGHPRLPSFSGRIRKASGCVGGT